MARRKHHRRRSYRGLADLVSVPSMGGMDLKKLNPLKKSVSTNDVFIGAAIGLIGGGLLRKFVLEKPSIAAKLPMWAQNHIAALSGGLAGLGAYALLSKKAPSRAQGVWVGAIMASVGPSLWEMSKGKIPGLNDLVSVNLNGYGRYGMIVDDSSDRMNGYAGMLVDDTSDARSLAAYSMARDEYEEDDIGLI